MNNGHKEWSHRAVNDIATLEDDDIEDLIAKFRPSFDHVPRARPVRAVLFFTNKSFPNSLVFTTF